MRKLTRKETRKAERQLKKAKRLAFSSRKMLSDVISQVPGAKRALPPVKKKRKKKSKTPNVEPDRKEPQLLAAEMEKERRMQQKQMALEEEKEARRYAKKLGLNKRRNTATLPQSLREAGFDYLLDVCDTGRRKLTAESDTDRKMSDSSDQEMSDNESMESEGPDEYYTTKNQKSVKLVRKSEKKKVAFSDESPIPQKSAKRPRTESATSDVSPSEEGPSDGEDDVSVPKEDIYGRVIGPGGAARPSDSERKVKLQELEQTSAADSAKVQKQIKGLINRVSESTMHSACKQLEQLYQSFSRNEVKRLLSSSALESLAVEYKLPYRLIMEQVLMLAVLHSNLSSEITAFFVEALACKFIELYEQNGENKDDKSLHNLTSTFAHLYNFKVIQAKLIFELLRFLLDRFKETDVEFLLILLTDVGFSLRKEDPKGLKMFIQEVQSKIASAEGTLLAAQSKVRFMFDTLMAIKNNNILKVTQNYDTGLLDHFMKVLRGYKKGSTLEAPLPMGLHDLLEAQEKGRWWVVGSAWSSAGAAAQQPSAAHTETDAEKLAGKEQFPPELVELARKCRMNTELRRTIFCILMTSQGHMDAFERLLKLNLKDQQERELVHISVACCLREKAFNSYYALLLCKFCAFHRRFQLTTQYAIWDRIKDVGDLNTRKRSNLAALIAYLIRNEAQPLAVLKVVEFAELESMTSELLQRTLTLVLLDSSVETLAAIFGKLAKSPKLKLFRDGLRLFFSHVMVREREMDVDDKLTERINLVQQYMVDVNNEFAL